MELEKPVQYQSMENTPKQGFQIKQSFHAKRSKNVSVCIEIIKICDNSGHGGTELLF